MKKKVVKAPSKVWIIAAICLVVAGIGVLFIPTVHDKITDMFKNKVQAPVVVSVMKPPVEGIDLSPIVKNVQKISVDSVDKKLSILDRILDSIDRIIGSAVAVIGALILWKQYHNHKEVKRRAKDPSP